MLRDQTLDLLARHGVAADATADEQQLVDPAVIDALIETSGLKASDTVLEIGPGAGNITVELAKRAAKVYAIEKNRKFVQILSERLGKSAEVVFGDALTLYLPQFDVLVSNLPFAIVEATLHRLRRIRFRVASILVPINFANIVTAKPGEPQYSKLTLEANLYYDVRLVKVIKQAAYAPEPRTETAIITLKPRRAANPKEAVIWHLLQQGDKKVSNALREALISIEGYPQTKKTAKEAVDKMGLEEQLQGRRVAALSLADIEHIQGQLGDTAEQLPGQH